jgi:hypothetical protein
MAKLKTLDKCKISKNMQRNWEMAYLDRMKNVKPLTKKELKDIEDINREIQKLRKGC